MELILMPAGPKRTVSRREFLRGAAVAFAGGWFTKAAYELNVEAHLQRRLRVLAVKGVKIGRLNKWARERGTVLTKLKEAQRALKTRSYGLAAPKNNSNLMVNRDASIISDTALVETIRARLTERRSPAAASAESFLKWSKHYGVNPLVVMSFFRMESNFGIQGRGARNNAVGNIRYSPPQKGGLHYTNNKGFREYATWDVGIQDFCRLIASKIYFGAGKNTLSEIVPIYAPAKENNVPRYVKIALGEMALLTRRENARRLRALQIDVATLAGEAGRLRGLIDAGLKDFRGLQQARQN